MMVTDRRTNFKIKLWTDGETDGHRNYKLVLAKLLRLDPSNHGNLQNFTNRKLLNTKHLPKGIHVAVHNTGVLNIVHSSRPNIILQELADLKKLHTQSS